MMFSQIYHKSITYPFNMQTINLLQYATNNILDMYTQEDYICIKQYVSKVLADENPDIWERLLIENKLSIEYNSDLWKNQTEIQCKFATNFYLICVPIYLQMKQML